MRWLLRFLAWASVLALPSWLLGDLYHRGLAHAAMSLLGLPFDAGTFQPPDIPASHILGVFAAMCLASTRAPRTRRLWALGIGIACMVAIELATGVLAIHWELEAASGRVIPATLHRLRNYVTSLPAWIEAPVLWLVLLGRHQLPRGAWRRGVAERRGPGG